jgi:predicted permease
VGPRLIDSEHAPDLPDIKEEFSSDHSDEHEDEENGQPSGYASDGELSPTDRTSLIPSNFHRPSIVPVSFFPSKPKDSFSQAPEHHRRPSVIPKKRWDEFSHAARWWLLFFYDFLNAPLLGAVLGTIIGLIPPLHRAFFNDSAEGGIFTAWLTASLQNIGMIFVPLPVLVAGVSLYTSVQKAEEPHDHPPAKTPWLTTLFVLVIRFFIWPVLSIGVVYGLAMRTDILGEDPMLWFALMLMPTGPPAMKLITMVEVSDADEEDEHKIAKLLTVSNLGK